MGESYVNAMNTHPFQSPKHDSFFNMESTLLYGYDCPVWFNFPEKRITSNIT
jgi:hypothetical protein